MFENNSLLKIFGFKINILIDYFRWRSTYPKTNLMEDSMGELMTILAFGTLGAVSVLAYISARVTEKLKDDPSHKRSSLCATSEHWAETR